MHAEENAVSETLARMEQVETIAREVMMDAERLWIQALLSEASRAEEPDYVTVGHSPVREMGVPQIDPSSQLGADEAAAPGYLDYLHQLVQRAGFLALDIARQTADMYTDKGVRVSFAADAPQMYLHYGAEAPLALARIELELIGRVRAILIPRFQGARLKGYLAAHHFDLTQAESMTEEAQPRLAHLNALIPTVAALEGEPEVYALSRRRTELEQWRLSPGATARHLASNRKGPDLYRMLSEAVHGGALIQAHWFDSAAGESPFGLRLLSRVAEVLRFELTELHVAIERLSKVEDL